MIREQCTDPDKLQTIRNKRKEIAVYIYNLLKERHGDISITEAKNILDMVCRLLEDETTLC